MLHPANLKELSEAQTKEYLARIGINLAKDAPLPMPSLTLLSQVLAHHLLAVPFSNLGIHLPSTPSQTSNLIPLRQGIVPPLTLPSLFAKIVTRKRGGVCFEVNALLHAMLVSLGFDAVLSPARLPFNQSLPLKWRPDTWHVVVLVRGVEGRDWMVDAGWGGGGASVPLPLEDGATGEGFGGERFRIVRLGDVQVEEWGGWALESERDSNVSDNVLESMKVLCRFGAIVASLEDLKADYWDAMTAPYRYQPRQLMMYRPDGIGGRFTFSTPKKEGSNPNAFPLGDDMSESGLFRIWNCEPLEGHYRAVKVEERVLRGLDECLPVWKNYFDIDAFEEDPFHT
ncbi:hypothetical protein BC830DRAFT_1172233 [Chytriomyces sp. MP71]|nr:hypothetical protein BC830DRAFT_1172233 [Chytriomyces sp. MP71]